MSTLTDALDDYLTVRRTLGYKLELAGRFLPGFVADIEATGTPTITNDLAVAWATKVPSRVWAARRLAMVRPFARHVQALVPGTDVPPIGLLPYRIARANPYLYSDSDIYALMATARSLHPRLRAATLETFIGLLAVTGMRAGEAVSLARDDVDLNEGIVTIWDSKFRKSRALPVHPTTIEALARYAEIRDACWPRPKDQSFLLSDSGQRLHRTTLQSNFTKLVRATGLDATQRRRPRPHDFRHTFAVRTVLGWYRSGTDVNGQMPLLSTYLGHVDPVNTYWYLTATPELLLLAADRLGPNVGATS